MPMADNHFIVTFCFLLHIKAPGLQWELYEQQILLWPSISMLAMEKQVLPLQTVNNKSINCLLPY